MKLRLKKQRIPDCINLFFLSFKECIFGYQKWYGGLGDVLLFILKEKRALKPKTKQEDDRWIDDDHDQDDADEKEKAKNLIRTGTFHGI